MKKAYFNWSGGKDCSLALYHTLKDPSTQLDLLVTTLSKEHRRISMHGVTEELLDQQAARIDIPLRKVWLPESPDMSVYNQEMGNLMKDLKDSGFEHAFFGDIFLEDLKAYRVKRLAEVDITGHFPLWKQNTRALLTEFIDLGFKAVLVCIDERYLDKSFAGRIIDHSLIGDLPDTVDPCGENGEFHTFVFDGPIFNEPVPYQLGEIIYRQYDDPTTGSKHKTGFWYQELKLA